MKALLALVLLAAAVPAQAASLTVRAGETWLFSIRGGQPVNARKVASSAKPAPGQVRVSVMRTVGTTMFLNNNSATSYTFRAELLSGGKSTSARACTLPANGRPALEQWPQKADAVRLSAFKATSADGSCP